MSLCWRLVFSWGCSVREIPRLCVKRRHDGKTGLWGVFERLPTLQVRVAHVWLSLKDDGGNDDPRKLKKKNTYVYICAFLRVWKGADIYTCILYTGDILLDQQLKWVWGQDLELQTWGQWMEWDMQACREEPPNIPDKLCTGYVLLRS